MLQKLDSFLQDRLMERSFKGKKKPNVFKQVYVQSKPKHSNSKKANFFLTTEKIATTYDYKSVVFNCQLHSILFFSDQVDLVSL